MTLISIIPFLLFDISAQFSSDITDLSLIPHDIYVYGDHYRLGGATAYVADRSHYVGYICDTNNQILFYDGLPSLSPVLRAYPQNAIYGEISLLVYFPYENGLKQDNVSNFSDSKINCHRSKPESPERTNNQQKVTSIKRKRKISTKKGKSERVFKHSGLRKQPSKKRL